MVLVRPARPEDVDLLVEFQRQMAMETERLELDTETLRQGIRAVFDDPALGEYHVAEWDGEVVGCLLVLPEWSDWRNGTVWWIHSLYVRPEFRRRGVFTALYRHLKQRVAGDESLKGLRLYVEQGNVVAHAAYEAAGMNAEHYRMYEWLKCDR